ncbi:MAG: PAS domain-containing protein, partial [Pygmaiobacter sp.]
VSFTPSTINNWYTFSLSSDALMLQQERITREIVIELILSLSVFGSFLMIWIAIGHQRHNKELLAANQKYHSLLSHINGGMIVAHHAKTAEETLLTYVSPGFTDMTGYTLEEIQREYHGQYLELVRSEERATVFQKYLEQIENDTCYRIPYRIHKKDGSFLWVMDNGYRRLVQPQYSHGYLPSQATRRRTAHE